MFALFQPVSYHKATAWAIAATAGWKGVSFLNSILIALYFGMGGQTDVYFYLIMLTGLGVTFLQKMNTSVLLPEAQAKEAAQPGTGHGLLNAFLYFYLVLGLVIMAAGLWIPVRLGGAFSAFSAVELGQSHCLLAAAFCLFAAQLWTSYLSSLLEMNKRFGVVLLSPLNALLPLAALLLWSRQIGIISMVYGFLVATWVQTGCFVWLLRTRMGWTFKPSLKGFHSKFHKNLLSNQVLEAVGLMNGFLPLYLISGLSGGLISALNYAKQLSDSTAEVFTQRVSGVSKIQLAEDAATQNHAAFNAHFLQTNRLMLFVLAPLCVFSFAYATDILTLFFTRGQFTPANAAQAAGFLRPLLMMTFLLSPILMHANALSSARKLKEAFAYLLFSNLLFTALVVLGVKTWGAYAYPYTQVFCCLVGFAVNARLFAKHLPKVEYKRSLTEAVRLALLSLGALGPALGVSWVMGAQSPLLKIAVSGVVFVAGWYALVRKSGDLTLFLAAAKARGAHQ